MDAYDKALSLLALREHTVKNMKEKLLKKGYSPEEADEALSSLTAENSISDTRFAHSFVSSTLKRKAWGKYILVQRLIEKGVDKETAETAVNEAWESEDYIPVLKKEYARQREKYGDDKAKMKLLSKGFTMSEIRKAVEDDN